MRLFRFRDRSPARLLPMTVLAVATACADAPTSTPSAPIDGPSLSIAAVPVGAPVTIPLPADNHPDNGVGGVWHQMQTLSGSGFYLIKVTGAVTHSWNSECEDEGSPVIDCDKSLDGLTLGPLDNRGAAYIALGSVAVGLTMQNGQSPSRQYLQPLGTGAATFVRFASPTTLWARRSIFIGCNWTVWSSCGDGHIPQYFLSGSNQVAVFSVPTPIAVDAPGSVAPGASAAFSAETVEGYPIDSWAVGHRAIYWTFMQGDTLSQPGSGTAVGVYGACISALTCSYQPAGSGRMRVTAYLNGQVVTGYSGIIRVEPPKMVLACASTSVTRGSSLSCNVTATGGATLTQIQWGFVDSLTNSIPGPQNAPSWGGIMAISGELSVSALLNGQPVSADTPIVVTPRTWGPITMDVREQPNQEVPAPAFVTALSHLGRSNVGYPDPYLITQVDSGPNEGWAFLAQEPELVFAANINLAAFQSGSAWAVLQTGNTFLDSGGVARPYCDQHDLPDILRRVRAHEGSVPDSTIRSHADAARDWLQANPRQDTLERLRVYVPTSGTNVDNSFDQFLTVAILTDVNNAPSVHNHTTDPLLPGIPPPMHPCGLRPWN